MPLDATNRFAEGQEFRSSPRPMTRERMRWYVDTQWTVLRDTGRIVTQPPTIHDDDDYARKQGLPGIIADGMISTNWILSLLIDVFGPQVMRKGRFSTKYIAPVYESQVLISVARIAQSRAAPNGGRELELEVWCEDDSAKKVTVGRASITLEAA